LVFDTLVVGEENITQKTLASRDGLNSSLLSATRADHCVLAAAQDYFFKLYNGMLRDFRDMAMRAPFQ